jgi:type III secretory pathway component EscU
MMLHAVFFGELSFAYLLVLVLPKLAKSNDLVSAAKTAGLIGFLVGLGVNLVQFGVMNVGTVVAHAVDPITYAVRWAAAGAVISRVLRTAQP